MTKEYNDFLREAIFWTKYFVRWLFRTLSNMFDSVCWSTLAQVFSCEFWEIFKNTFLTQHFRTIAFIIVSTTEVKCSYIKWIDQFLTFNWTKFNQIVKVLINDHLRVSKVSWKLRIANIYNFAIIYPWNLLFSLKVAYLLIVSIVFSIYKQNFTVE